MNSTKNEPIRLSDSETELLTRALAEAQEQAEGPRAVESDTQLFRRTPEDRTRKAGNTQQVQGKSHTMVL
ncbi:MAG TPA: hypothetical protein VFT34_03940 [Verrucomicrobiae bacterium]|nr:hypothetical protein [Verrucomicrobiae bacterium]